jgi:hypothetical protein
LYLDPDRAFGGVLNDADERLAYYQRVIAAAEAECRPTAPAEAPPCCWTNLLSKGSCR